MWKTKVVAAADLAVADAADAAETNWKNKVTPHWGDLITGQDGNMNSSASAHYLAHGQDQMGQMTMMLHNHRSTLFHIALNWKNPASGFRDMWSTKSGPHWYNIWLVFRLPIWTIQFHFYRSWQLHRTPKRENPSNSFRDMHSAKFGPYWYSIW